MTEARIVVHYPAARGRVCLRTEDDWSLDVEPVAGSPASGAFHFRIQTSRSHLAFKAVLRDARGRKWAEGDNSHWFGGPDPLDVFPYFEPDDQPRVSDIEELGSRSGERTHRFRVFCPPGYAENTLQRYPVVYLHDGPNVFFADESFSGHDWMIDDTLVALQAMQAVRPAIAVAIYPNDRMEDYTAPGYAAYGRYLVDDLVPWVDSHYRTLAGPAHRLTMGASLGGVVSLHLGWEHSDVFGNAACLSSTFGYRDDLAARIAGEPRRELTVYLDSGWPGDNYEVTRAMRDLLASRGFRSGVDLHYLAFPHDPHHETAWSRRAHLPLQLCLDPGVRTQAAVGKRRAVRRFDGRSTAVA